jgi:hypothetical protein
MKPESEVSRMVSPEDAEIAIASYNIVGYRIVGLEYEGAYAPARQEDGSLIVDTVGAAALRDCLTESIRYNKAFKARLFEGLRNQKVMPAQEHLDNTHNAIQNIDARLKDFTRVRKVLKNFLSHELEEAEEAAA